MRKNYWVLITILLFGLSLAFTSCSSDDDQDIVDEGTTISYETLPDGSKQFITTHFSEYKVAQALDVNTGYTVDLNSTLTSTAGYKVKFDRQGDWVTIEGRNDAVLPDNVLALIPRTILSYISQYYPTRGITEIEKETYGYKVELAGNPDVELMFDTNGGYLAKDGEEQVITYNQLPDAAQSFLATHFANLTPSKVKKDGDSYDVDYANGISVDFDLLGNWYEVDVNSNQMPASVLALLPQTLTNYLSANYSGKKIESVTNKLSTYEVELAGDIDLVFDKNGNLWSSNNNGNTGGNSSGNNRGRIAFTALPQTIQTYLNQHFLAATTFLYAEKDDDEYEVKLANGTSLGFSLAGELKTVEVIPGNSVPESVMNAKVVSYIKANYANRKIEEYEKKAQGFKVELSGYPEIELLFDANGNFKRLD